MIIKDDFLSKNIMKFNKIHIFVNINQGQVIHENQLNSIKDEKNIYIFSKSFRIIFVSKP